MDGSTLSLEGPADNSMPPVLPFRQSWNGMGDGPCSYIYYYYCLRSACFV